MRIMEADKKFLRGPTVDDYSPTSGGIARSPEGSSDIHGSRVVPGRGFENLTAICGNLCKIWHITLDHMHSRANGLEEGHPKSVGIFFGSSNDVGVSLTFTNRLFLRLQQSPRGTIAGWPTTIVSKDPD